MKVFLHIAVGGSCGLLRTAAVPTGAEVRRVPGPPVVLGVRLLVGVMVRRLAEELCNVCDVQGSCSGQLPLAAGKPRLNFLEQPAVPVRILERGKRAQPPFPLGMNPGTPVSTTGLNLTCNLIPSLISRTASSGRVEISKFSWIQRGFVEVVR